MSDLASALKAAEEALSLVRQGTKDHYGAAAVLFRALEKLADAAREEKCENERLARLHEGCDTKTRSLVSQGLAAIRRAEKAEAALAEAREALDEIRRRSTDKISWEIAAAYFGAHPALRSKS